MHHGQAVAGLPLEAVAIILAPHHGGVASRKQDGISSFISRVETIRRWPLEAEVTVGGQKRLRLPSPPARYRPAIDSSHAPSAR